MCPWCWWGFWWTPPYGLGVWSWIFPLLGLGIMFLFFLGMLGWVFGWWRRRPYASLWRWEEPPRRKPSSDEVAELREEIRALREEVKGLKK